MIVDHLGVPEPPSPSYEELSALVVGLASELERAQARIPELEALETAKNTLPSMFMNTTDHEILGLVFRPQTEDHVLTGSPHLKTKSPKRGWEWKRLTSISLIINGLESGVASL